SNGVRRQLGDFHEKKCRPDTYFRRGGRDILPESRGHPHTQVRRMPAQLLALTDGPSILLDKPILLLGRHGEGDVQLHSRKASRRHCCVAQVRDYLVVRDLGSTNGVRINGHRVLEGKLQSGDELTIGNFRYQVYLEAPSSNVNSSTTPPPKPGEKRRGPSP